MLTKILPEVVILKTTFPVKVGDIHKIRKKNSIVISVFSYKNKEKYPMYISKKCCEEKHVDLLLTEKKGKRDYVLIKDFNTFMCNHTLHRRKKYFVVIVYKFLVQKKY